MDMLSKMDMPQSSLLKTFGQMSLDIVLVAAAVTVAHGTPVQDLDEI